MNYAFLPAYVKPFQPVFNDTSSRFQPPPCTPDLDPCLCPKTPIITGKQEAEKAAQDIVTRVAGDLKLEFGTKEASFSARLEPTNEVEAESGELKCLGKDDARRLLSLLGLLPHGVVKMSHDLEGLVSRRVNHTSTASPL